MKIIYYSDNENLENPFLFFQHYWGNINVISHADMKCLEDISCEAVKKIVRTAYRDINERTYFKIYVSERI
jgi:hypothetical protein